MVPLDQLPFEYLLNALRLTEGFPLAQFSERTGLPLTTVLSEFNRASAEGLLERDHLRARPTAKGQRFLNTLLERFLP